MKTVLKSKHLPQSCWRRYFPLIALFSIPILLFLIFSVTSSHSQPTYSPGEILVKLRSSALKPSDFHNLAHRYELQSSEPLYPSNPRGAKPVKTMAFNQVYRLRILANPPEAAKAFAAHPNVVYSEPNYLYYHSSVQNDPMFTDQINLEKIHWQDLWKKIGPIQKQAIIAIVDSGVDYIHEDLAENIWINSAEFRGQPGLDDDSNGYVDDIRGWDFTDAPNLPGKGDFLTRDNDPLDESGHGTHVAGIAAAISNNAVGIGGIAPDAKLMVLRAGATLLSDISFLEADDLAAAIVYAVENGAHILNMSWGSKERSFLIQDAVRYAAESGVILVSSAGNSGNSGLFYPGAFTETISVGATDRNDLLASFSSVGPTLDLTAPGVNILSTLPNNAYGLRSGSSISAPHVSGLAALLLSRRPELTHHQIKTLLSTSALDLGALGWDERFGAGRIDSAPLLIALTSPVKPPIVQILAPYTDEATEKTFNIIAHASGESLTSYRISWGLGRSPESWTLLQSGPPKSHITCQWTVSELPDSVVIIRLEADIKSKPSLEHRVRVLIQRSSPSILALGFGPELEGPDLVYRVRWSSDQPSEGYLLFRPFEATTEDTLSSGIVNHHHTVTLPSNLPTGPLLFRILARGPAGHTTLSPTETLPYLPFRVPQNGYNEIATLPNGFLSDRLTDYNGNGKPEIILMPYIEGQAFSPTLIYEWESTGNFRKIFQSTSNFLPWTIGDANGDGHPDLLGTEFARLRIFSGNIIDPFPSQQILDLNETWGGEIIDLDGNGQNEIIVRSLDNRDIRVLTLQGVDTFEQVAFLPNPTPGSGHTGPRFVMGDFDGDSRNELLAGDDDGDLWIYESQTGRIFTPTWKLEGNDATDARLVGGGVDLDGDNHLEFFVARALPEEGEAINGHWELEAYSASASNTYVLEWSTRISGVISTGNGITTGDLNGDGKPELVVCLRPDLYIFQSDKPDLYRPIFHTKIGLTHRPLIADLDLDNKPEILFNKDQAIRVWELQKPSLDFISPQILSAHPLGVSRAILTWMVTPEATNYRLYRRSETTPFSIQASNLTKTAYIDTGLTENFLYHYQVAAVIPNKDEMLSNTVTVRPNPPPKLLGIHTNGPRILLLTFNEPLHSNTANPGAYSIVGMGHPTSALLDRESQRIVLTFASTFDPKTVYTLRLLNVADTSGVPLDPRFRTSTFTPKSKNSTLIQLADFDGNAIVGFSDFLLFSEAFGSSNPIFDLDRDTIVSFSDFLLFTSVFGKRVSH